MEPEPESHRIIRSPEELTELLTGPYFGEGIRLRLPRVDKSEQAFWEERLNASYHECGCNVGAAVLAVGLAAVLLVVVGYGFAGQGLGWGSVVGLVLGVAFISGLAKELTVWRARRRLKRDIAIVRQKASDEPTPITCG